jgi:tight adherence protein C
MGNLEGLGMVLAVVVAVSAAGLVGTVGLLMVDRVSLRSKLREIDDLYQLVDLRDQELMLPFSDRVAEPVMGVLSKLGRRFSPSGRVEQIAAMLRRAGRPEADADRYLAMRVLSIIAAPVVAVVTWNLTASIGGMTRLMATAVAVSCCTILPSRRLRREVEVREENIRKQLPDLLDLLVICMEAGLGFSAAVSRTVANLEGEMAEEFSLALGEMRAGASRSDALSNLAERVQIAEVRSFVVSIKQADQFGISVSSVLREKAADMRVFRRQAAQEKAQKAPVKMLIPMVFCIFPPLFLIVIGPAGISITNSGGF